MNQDEIAKAMLGMAEALRTQDPPKLKMAIKCARGALKLNISEEMTAVVNYQFGKLLFFYTDNCEMAKTHLQAAYDKMSAMGTFYMRDKMHTLSMIADLHIHYQLWPILNIKNSLKHEISTTRGYPLLTYKLMFQLIELFKIDKDAKGAFEICQAAIEHCHDNPRMELYFRITRTLVAYKLLREEPDNAEMTKIGAMIKALEEIPSEKAHVGCIKDFYVLTKLSHMFYEGKSRTSRQLLRQIQRPHTTSDGNISGIRWLGDMSMTIFACVMNIVGAFVQSNSDRVEKYFYLAIKHTDEILLRSTRTPQEPGVVRCMSMIKMTTLEMMAAVNVMACRPQKMLGNVRDMLEMTHRSSGPFLYRYFAPHIQYILGLQCCYLRQNEAAEKHFKSAITMFEKHCLNPENSIAFLNLNLAITYLNQLKMAEYYDVAECLTPTKISGCSQMLKNNIKFLHVVYSFLTNKTNENKNLVMEVLADAKAEDFFRLHGLALAFMSLTMPVDDTGVQPTIIWSKKSHDHFLSMWSNNLYERLLRNAGHQESSEMVQNAMHEQIVSQKAMSLEVLLPMVANMPTAKLLQWFEGDPYKLLPRDEATI